MAKDLQQSIIDGVAEPIMVIDADYRVNLMNRAALESWGRTCPPESLLCYQISHQRETPCDGAEHPCPLNQARESGQPVTVMHEHYQAPGERRNVKITASPVWGSDGSFRGVIESTHDITEQAQMEAALRQSEETARALLNAPTDTAILVDAEGTILAINEIGAQRFGKSGDELIGTCGYDLVPPDLARSRKAMADQVVRTGVPVHFEDERAGIIFESQIYPVLDAQGEVTRLAVFGKDVTEQRRKEVALKKSEAKNRALLDAIPDMMFRVRKDGTFLEFKPAKGLEPLLPPNKFLGKPVSEVMPRELAQQIMYYITRTLESGATQQFEYSLLEKGNRHHYEARLAISGVQTDEVLAIVRDISQRKAREAMVQVERERIARDLHDDLAQRIYFLGLKLDYLRRQVRRDPEGVISELNTLRKNVQAIIQDVRRTIFVLQPVNLEGTDFGSALRQYTSEFGGQMGLDIMLNIEGDEAALSTDLEMVFFRLVQEGLNNVAKHADACRAWVKLAIETGRAGRLTIRDDGLGFDPQALTPTTNGVRLGLRQMRERVTGLGGQFSLESAPDQGTTLHVEIPL